MFPEDCCNLCGFRTGIHTPPCAPCKCEMGPLRFPVGQHRPYWRFGFHRTKVLCRVPRILWSTDATFCAGSIGCSSGLFYSSCPASPHHIGTATTSQWPHSTHSGAPPTPYHQEYIFSHCRQITIFSPKQEYVTQKPYCGSPLHSGKK